MAGKSVEDDRKGKVLQGTCGWSDSSIVKCGRFYPASVKTSEDRLLHYSRFFPCVECDSSNYAIPSPTAVDKWVKCVPAGFKFHFKAFGLFTRKSISPSTLPHVVRDELPESITKQQSSILWEELTQAQKQNLWDRFNSALLPAHQRNKLGVVIFQFHLGYQPTDVNKRHIEECRKYLDVRYLMAVEFRSRVWFSTEHLPSTLDWLRQQNLGLVVADDLQNEEGNPLFPSLRDHDKTRRLYVDKSNVGDHGKDSVSGVVPIVMELGSCDFAYVRVHRRTGKHRLLDEEEIKSWGERLCSPKLQDKIRGPIYFMWGTDHEDQPIINSKNLTKELGALAYNWKDKISNSGMLKFCSKVTQESQTEKVALKKESVSATKKSTAAATDREDLCPKTEDLERGDSDPPSGHRSTLSKVDRTAASGSAKKRTSTSSLVSLKKRQASGSMKAKISTPSNQRTISDFFKK